MSEINRQTLTVEEMGDVLGISRPKAYELVHAKNGPPALRIGRCIRIPTAGLQAWMERESNREEMSC